jgi:hypothetical protein
MYLKLYLLIEADAAFNGVARGRQGSDTLACMTLLPASEHQTPAALFWQLSGLAQPQRILEWRDFPGEMAVWTSTHSHRHQVKLFRV